MALIEDYIMGMNIERLKCEAPPFYVDERLQSIAEERLIEMGSRGFSHYYHGEDPKLPLMKKYGWPIRELIRVDGEWLASISEGLSGDSYDPPGLMIPSEQYPYEKKWAGGRMTHHNDMINPYWNFVGYAFGISNGRKFDVVNYGNIK